VITTSPSPAPINVPGDYPGAWDKSAQPALFQLRIKPLPHSSAITCCARASAGHRTCAEGVTVEVDHPLRQGELVTQRRQPVLVVKGLAMASSDHGLSWFL